MPEQTKSNKDIKFHLNIAQHDKETKLKHCIKFLQQDHRVRLTLQMVGREQGHPERAVAFLNDAVESLKEYGKANGPVVVRGRDATVFIFPLSKKS